MQKKSSTLKLSKAKKREKFEEELVAEVEQDFKKRREERLLLEDNKSDKFIDKHFEIMNRKFLRFYSHPIDAITFFTTKRNKLTNNLSGFINSFTSPDDINDQTIEKTIQQNG